MRDSFFHDKKPNPNRLLAYGFVLENAVWHYSTDMLDGQFSLCVWVGAEGRVHTRVTDRDSGGEYILHRTAGAVGAFVGKVKAEYEAILADIAQNCFEPHIFQSAQAQAVIAFVRENYGDELEFLWEKFPENAVWRRKDNGKWYAALLRISACKLGMDTNETIEIIDLRLEPEKISSIVDGVRCFPGYHMNKKHWITFCLDQTVPLEEIYARIRTSYGLAAQKPKKKTIERL